MSTCTTARPTHTFADFLAALLLVIRPWIDAFRVEFCRVKAAPVPAPASQPEPQAAETPAPVVVEPPAEAARQLVTEVAGVGAVSEEPQVVAVEPTARQPVEMVADVPTVVTVESATEPTATVEAETLYVRRGEGKGSRYVPLIGMVFPAEVAGRTLYRREIVGGKTRYVAV